MGKMVNSLLHYQTEVQNDPAGHSLVPASPVNEEEQWGSSRCHCRGISHAHAKRESKNKISDRIRIKSLSLIGWNKLRSPKPDSTTKFSLDFNPTWM